MVVFEVATARRVGAHLRYNGGPRLDEIRCRCGSECCHAWNTIARANGADLEDRQHHEPETETESASAIADYKRALGIAQ
ncbi:hypothetical protein [Micromonospora sp. NPDC051006]|uniref:hypothetical protein n=1 Tax=Micromonospora sp. NPDC051006 TaxID=3364283 RepID=UPI0037BAAE0E